MLSTANKQKIKHFFRQFDYLKKGFLSLASLVRKLHTEYISGQKEKNILLQTQNIRSRLNLIRYMLGLGIFSFLCCVLCKYCIFRG